MKKYLLPLLILPLSLQLSAAVYKTVQIDKTYENDSCQQSDSCDLKSFRVRVEDSKVVSSSFGTNYTTGSFTEYQTSNVDTLTKYAVVQFIKGCQFYSTPDGRKFGGISREFFNEIVPFKHPQWVIDSVDRDPIYNSATEFGDNRHAYYRWNEVLGSFKKETEHYFVQQTPVRPILYVLDRPGTAFYDDHEYKDAKNISLQFKTCIYKTADVPKETTPDDLNFAKAIKCFDWKSSFVFNHKKKVYESPNKIDEYCTTD